MVVDIAFANILVYLLVFVRLAGMLVFNPLLSRRNVPAQVRVGLVVFLALLISPLQPESVVEYVYGLGMVGLVVGIFKELFIGIVYGFVFQVFYYLLFFVGDVIDTDIGISMAKTFDPATNIQTGFSSSLVTILFVLYVFATDSHLALFQMFALSFEQINVGALQLSTNILSFGLTLFTQVVALVLRLAAPIMVAEFVLQFSMGVLMKFIPQITVFVINFQLRILIGLLLLFALAPFIGQFIDNYIDIMFASLVQASEIMVAG